VTGIEPATFGSTGLRLRPSLTRIRGRDYDFAKTAGADQFQKA